jgi:hypothetical protein
MFRVVYLSSALLYHDTCCSIPETPVIVLSPVINTYMILLYDISSLGRGKRGRGLVVLS